jgi:methylmalonyl-CoA mutase cobalamin-binding subunit
LGKRILGAAIGQCVHVAGVLNFLGLARECGHETEFLGAAVSIDELIGAAREYAPDLLAVSYRLTPATAAELFDELRQALKNSGLEHSKAVFGGTPPVVEVAVKSGLFEAAFSGEENVQDVVAYLRGVPADAETIKNPGTLTERVAARSPYPILRHHFGLPSLEETIQGATRIAESGMLDVLSIGPDQNTQFSFFRPDEMDPRQDGAGGVPLRKAEDLEALYQATRCGNYPLLRIYAGTRDLIQWAKLVQDTIKNAWAAIPLFWYSKLDGRSNRSLVDAIRENQQAIKWHADRNIPVEVNDPHHWSLRDASDAVAVADAYLSAYNAKALGVTTFVAQLMWNTPPAITPAMDLAKMLAKMDLIKTLTDPSFRVLTECRAGLASFSPKTDLAKGQLAASTMLSLALKPDIIHVVAFCEANHEATPDDIIESCGIVHGVLKNVRVGMPDYTLDETVQARRNELVREAQTIVDAIGALGQADSADPLADPAVLARAVQTGILDAPHLVGNSEARGLMATRIIDGACRSVDSSGRPISEQERLKGSGAK